MAIKENALPLGASSGSGSYIRTVSSGGESQRTSFDVVKGAMNADIETALENEVSAREDADTALSEEITDAVEAEVTARNQAIASAIATEVTDRNAAIAEAQGETAQAISTAISGEVTARNQAIASAIQTETADRTAAIQEAIADEVTDRNAAIESAIDDEETARNTAISEAVAAEAQAREAADEELNQSKANTDGNYPDMTVGNADQLLSSIYTEDQIPYNFRQAGGGLSIGDREIDKIVGGTIVWNQLCNELNANNWSGSNTTRVYSDGVATVTPSAIYGIISQSGVHSGVKVIKPSHKYLALADVKAVSNTTLSFVIGDNSNFTNVKTFTATTSWAQYGGILNISASAVANAVYYGIRSGDANNLAEYQLKNFCLFDLTAMLGSAIADYIYSLEQATAGAGVAYFKKLFPKPYYAYNAGELMSVQAASHDMVGFNQLPVELVYRSTTTVLDKATAVRVVPDTQYQLTFDDIGSATNWRIGFKVWGLDGNLLTDPSCFTAISGMGSPYWNASSNIFVEGQNASEKSRTIQFNVDGYVQFSFLAGDTTEGMATKNACLHFVHNGSRNGEYEPYEKHSYELDSGLTLRGIPKLDASNNLYYDGDEYESDGSVNRRYAETTYTSVYQVAQGDGGLYYWMFALDPVAPSTNTANIISDRFVSGGFEVGKCYVTNVGKLIVAVPIDQSLNTKALADAWLANNPVTFEYLKATPTEESAAPYTNPQTVSDWGTEEYVDAAVQEGDRDVAVPVGHVTDYLANLRDKLQNLPDAANADGTYLVQQTSGQMALLAYTPGVNVPAAPTTDGTYTLQAVVSGGVATYSWVSS